MLKNFAGWQFCLTKYAGTPFKRVDESEWVGSKFHVTKDNSYFALGLDQSE
jgi:hypothetical protein